MVNTRYSVQRTVVELGTGNLYDFVSQCHPNTFNKKGEKLLNF